MINSLEMFVAFVVMGSLSFSFCEADSSVKCVESEREALLKLRQGFTDTSKRLSSWVGEDCCKWEGVSCSNTIGHVIKLNLHNPSPWATSYRPMVGSCDSSCLGGEINPSLVNLTHLEHFDLSMNNFSYGEIPSFLGSLKNLKYLDLGFAEFSGKIPHELGNLSNLQYLDLRMNRLTVDTLVFVSSLSSLKHLDLYGLDLSKASDWLYSINLIPSLVYLSLSDCRLFHIPRLLHVNFTSLSVLRLNGNNFNSPIPGWLFNISSMEELYLDESAFQGRIPYEIGNFKLLRYLDLSENDLEGPLPDSIGTLSNLTKLYITGSNLTGSVPVSVGQLSNLEMLDLHDNFLDGMITEHHFFNLTSLKELFLGQNPLAFNIDTRWIPPFQLEWLSVSSCRIGPNFPEWIKNQKNLLKIDMSNASISGSLPCWFDSISSTIHDLDLSYNQITKKLPKLSKLPSSDRLAREIYLDSNKFEGSLASIPSDIAVLDVSNNLLSGHIPATLPEEEASEMESLFLSNNNLSGNIPGFLCKMEYLNFLGLANNQLSGRLLPCWHKLQDLYVIDLANNNLSGEIPVSLGYLPQLVSLHLENNNLQGEIPVSLKNLTNLRALDFSGNAFSGTIPAWIGENLSLLKILNLHSNMFNGDIPVQLCHLAFIHLLDLGTNKLTGTIPFCFGNFTAMIFKENTSEVTWTQYHYLYTSYPHLSYDEHSLAYTKGTGLEYTRTLQFFFSVDLSGNNLTGEIPKGLMRLSGLQNLNLSGNNLDGNIPCNIGNLKLLESLDLARNQFSGSIPPAISNLNFLSHLNLSFNNFSGQIPSGNQIQTLDDKSIYIGNNGLCGFPLEKCSTDDQEHKGAGNAEKATAEDDSQRLWFFCGLAMGFTTGFMGICGILYFKDSWRYATFRFVDRIYNKLWVRWLLIQGNR